MQPEPHSAPREIGGPTQPNDCAESSSRETDASVKRADAPRTVLVVDDDPDLLEVTRFVLEGEGFGVETANDGAEALELLRAGTLPDLVLLDLMMPVMNGWQFLEEIAKTPSFKAVPIVVLTAAGSVEVHGAEEILRKPIDLKVLVAAVERYTRGGE